MRENSPLCRKDRDALSETLLSKPYRSEEMYVEISLKSKDVKIRITIKDVLTK